MSSRPTRRVWLAAIATVIVLVAATALGGARASSSSQAQAALTPIVYLPVIQNVLPPIIPPSTVPFDSATTQALSSVSADKSVVTFSQMTAQLQALAPG